MNQDINIVLDKNPENRWGNYKDLLLDADPSEKMIKKYLFQNDMFVMIDSLNSNNCLAEAVVSINDNKTIEIKNIAVSKLHQGKGYGKSLINYICSYYKSNFQIKSVTVGTSEYGQGFYEKCGFKFSHIIENFFLNNYTDPIFENGKQVKSMYYLTRDL